MDFELFINDQAANATPEKVVVSSQVVDQLTSNLKQTCLEFALYFFSLYKGEDKTIAGKDFKAVPFDIAELSARTGYGKSRIYEAVNNLIEMKVFRPIEFSSRNGIRRYLLVSNEVSLNFRDSTPVENTPTFSTPVETFHSSGKCKNRDNHKGAKDLQSSPQRKPPYYTKYNTSNLSDTNVNDVNDDNDVIDLFGNITNKYNNIYNTSIRIEYVNENGIKYELDLTKEETAKLEYFEQKIQECKMRRSEGEDVDSSLESLQRGLYSFLKDLVASKRSGYRASEYRSLESDYEPQDKNKAHIGFVAYYMSQVFRKRDVDFYIPKSRMGKYYARAKSIIQSFGSWAKTKDYIDWYIREDNHEGLGWSLDALVSSALLNGYDEAGSRSTRSNISKELVDSVEKAKEKSSKGIII